MPYSVKPHTAAVRLLLLAILVLTAGQAWSASKPHICFKQGTDPDYAAEITREHGYTPTQVEGGSGFELAPRWSTTATDGAGLGQGDPTTITWSYVPDGTPIGGFAGEPAAPSNLHTWLLGIYGDFNTYHDLFLEFFARWSELTGITYVYEPNDDGLTTGVFPSSPGIIGVRGDVRISAHEIDGNSGILAYNFFPDTGDMVIDSADNFFNNISNNSLGLRNVLAHEAGHGLGLDHSCPTNNTKLMEPFINLNFDGPQFDDTLGAQRHYGDANEHNDNAGSATPLGLVAPGGHAEQVEISIDDNSDQDLFSFDVGSGITSISLFAAPTTEPPYAAGHQLGNGSCTNGLPAYDPNPIHDLVLELVDTDGTTVLHTRDNNPAGQDESLLDVPLTGPATYYARVSGDSTSDIQLFDLDLDAAGSPPFCPGVPIASCDGAEKAGLKIIAGKKLIFKFKGPVKLVDFGNVISTDTTGYCLFADGALLSSAQLPPGAGKWQVKTGKKLIYKDKPGSNDGITKFLAKLSGLKLQTNASNLPGLPIGAASELRMQVVSSAGACYEAVFTPADMQEDSKKLKASKK